MELNRLVDIAQALVAGDKGLLAIDESVGTCNKRFAVLGIAQDEKTRRAYRELIVTTPGLGECISGVIVVRRDDPATDHRRCPVPDCSRRGRDHRRDQDRYRCEADGRASGGDGDRGAGRTPPTADRVWNADALARNAALCQEAGLVPIVEPKVLTAGESCPNQDSTGTVAAATIACLRRAVPAAVAGIAFLPGGQSGDLASAHLNAINTDRTRLPWPVAFSFGRAIQEPALTIWDGRDANVDRAQNALLQRRPKSNQDARRGDYTPPAHR